MRIAVVGWPGAPSGEIALNKSRFIGHVALGVIADFLQKELRRGAAVESKIFKIAVVAGIRVVELGDDRRIRRQPVIQLRQGIEAGVGALEQGVAIEDIDMADAVVTPLHPPQGYKDAGDGGCLDLKQGFVPLII